MSAHAGGDRRSGIGGGPCPEPEGRGVRRRGQGTGLLLKIFALGNNSRQAAGDLMH